MNGRPLRFFHFSGFKPDRPERLSSHQNRIQIGSGSALERICAEYGREHVEVLYSPTLAPFSNCAIREENDDDSADDNPLRA